MRRFFSISMISIFFTAIVSCNKQSSPSPVQSEFKVDKTTVSFVGESNSKDSITIQSNISWSIAVTANSWLNLSTTVGMNNTKVYLTTKESNTTGANREVTVTISPSNNTSVQPIVLKVTQLTSPTSVDSTSLLIGKWKVVNDSLANIGNYTNVSGYPIPGNYIGGANDYLDFRVDGKLYYQEAGYSGSTTFQLLPDNKISIYNFQPGMNKGSLLNLTSSSVTLYGTDTSANGGRVIKIINLKK